MWRSTRLYVVLTIHHVPFLFFVLSYYVSLRSEFRVVVSALGFPHKNDVRFVSTFILCCVLFSSSSCVPYVASISGLSLRYSLTCIYILYR
jgi:hypothetical protein